MKISIACKCEVLIISILLSGCISLDPSFTNEKDYFSKVPENNNPKIYSGEPSEGFLPVFEFRSHSADSFWLTGLALTNFSGDSIYNSIEIQKVEFKGENRIIVLLYHVSGQIVDVYHDKDLPLLKSELEKMVNHAEMHPSQLEASFGLDRSGYRMRLKMTDKYGRKIDLDLKDEKPLNKLVKLIAPIGAGINNPEYFPMLYLEDMRLASKKGSIYCLSIGDNKMKPAKIPFTPYYMTRYCSSICNAEWLPESEKVISPTESGNSDEVTNFYINNNGYTELTCQQFNFHGNKLTINYRPPIPDLPALKENQELDGRFCVNAASDEGLMAGIYVINKTNGVINIKVKPLEGWQPFPGKPWMTTYEWEAELSPKTGKTFSLKSEWKRRR